MITPKLLAKLLPSYLLMIAIFAGPLFFAHFSKLSAQKANSIYLQKIEHKQEPILSGQPVELEIPRFNLKLSIKNGGYDKIRQDWILDWQSAYYAPETALPGNQPGHTLIYGHDIPEVFKPTKQLTHGDQLIITTSNNIKLEYYFIGYENVKPNNISVLQKMSSRPELTLMTCDGAFSQNRRLMNFNYLRVL